MYGVGVGFGARSESSKYKARLLDQLEMQLSDFAADATGHERAAEAVTQARNIAAFQRQRPARQPFPESCRESPSVHGQGPLGQRLLQVVEQPVGVKRLLGVGASQQLVQQSIRNMGSLASCD